MPISQFIYNRLPAGLDILRQEVRAFLAQELKDRPALDRASSWMGFDADFSKKLGAKGWLGMALPKEYGGGEADLFNRYVVIEELLAAGAPVSAHWIADRQSAPLISRFGTEEQKQKYLPGICLGESYYCIGMSEPNSGSDLASVLTRARRKDGKWIVNGHKLWTTNAIHSHYMIALVRTQDQGKNRHAGLSQFIIDLTLDGITINPIVDMSGGSHFNEVFFDNVVLNEDALVGTEGDGWTQVMAELAYERSGPERYLSSIELAYALIDAVGPDPDAYQQKEIGHLTARLYTLRNMSISVTNELASGRDPVWAASCVKDLGTSLEQELPAIARSIIGTLPAIDGGDDYSQILSKITQAAPSFSLRGGTREILRGIISRGMGVA